jgi:glutaminyl-tRNA synthetase
MRKVKGTLHWVSIQHAIKAEIREYDRLFLDEAPDAHGDKSFMEFLNPESLKITKEAYLEPFLQEAKLEDKFQFQRVGYFTLDKDATSEHLIFNKTVGLKDSWAKAQSRTQNPAQPQQQKSQGQGRSPISEIQKISKKYTNLSGNKLETARASIAKLAEDVNYEDLEPLFGTAKKKVGTRIGVTIALGVLLEKGLKKNEAVNAFIQAGLEDDNDLLAEEAKKVNDFS